ncbi:MAG: peptidoglycan DD-metalloendopeptidase family protein [Oceanobacter sp.]
MSFIRRIIFTSLMVLASSYNLVASAASGALPKQSLIAGGVAVIDAGEQAEAPEIFLTDAQGKSRTPLMLITEPGTKANTQRWFALAGISLKRPPEQIYVSLNGKQLTIPVGQHQYEEQHLTVKKKHVNPSEEALARIRKEAKAMRSVFETFTTSLPQPADGPLSSPFGLQRFFNGERRNPHSGLDIAAPRGAPITAPMSGVVVQTGNYYFNGNTVLIDHGQGLISMFCHMDKIDVEEGTYLERGEYVGAIGATGRVTGPHLHWTLSLNNARVDPMLFLGPKPE